MTDVKRSVAGTLDSHSWFDFSHLIYKGWIQCETACRTRRRLNVALPSRQSKKFSSFRRGLTVLKCLEFSARRTFRRSQHQCRQQPSDSRRRNAATAEFEWLRGLEALFVTRLLRRVPYSHEGRFRSYIDVPPEPSRKSEPDWDITLKTLAGLAADWLMARHSRPSCIERFVYLAY